MTMRCKICTHPDRLKIDRELVKGGNLSQIAREFGVSYDSLVNHRKNHISRQLAQVWDKREVAENFDLLKKIDSIIVRAEEIFTRNYDNKKDTVALKALDSQRATIELLAKISYSLQQAKQAELELKLQQEGELGDEAFQEKIKILTTPEMVMLSRLQNKIENQTDEIIIPEEERFEDNFDIDSTEPEETHFDLEQEKEQQPAPKIKRTKSNRMTIRPVPTNQIPSS